MMRRRLLSSTHSISGWKRPAPFVATCSAEPTIASDYLVQILSSRVYDAAIETPLNYASSLSAILKNNIYLKREDTQPVFSFKIRGAHNKIACLSDEQRQRGVVACSAGNHAQGVALSAAKLGIRATIVMPEATPKIKVSAVVRFGGSTSQVILHGKNYDEAAAEAQRLQVEHGYTMIHPFDDPHVIAGQGTIGLEILKELNGQRLDAVFVCCGGGGMLAGIAAYIKAVRPGVKVIGVEADDAAGMTESLIRGAVTTLPTVGLFADGAAVRTVGSETFRVCHALVDEMITVSTDEICAGIKQCFNDTRCVLEPAGALAIAGMVKYSVLNGCEGHTFVATTSGANMDFDRLRFVSERADLSETLMAVTIPERPGSFRELYSVIYPRNVTEFSYRCNNTERANVFVSYQALSGRTVEEDKTAIRSELEGRGFEVTDLSGNEMAKSHARHLSGGRRTPYSTPSAANATTTTPSFASPSSGPTKRSDETTTELVYRFEFPEAPGALDTFLHTVNRCNRGWSITLFHYRNYGHDFGRVLVGLEVKESEKGEFSDFLKNLGYQYYEETQNAAYKQFLQ